jgi:hypothetical protein
MADAGTLSRISGILKVTYGGAILEQQNLTTVSRKRYKKAEEGWRAPGDHFELSARLGGNRASIAGTASDDALLPASRQNEKKFTIFDRGYSGTIKMYEKDIANTKTAGGAAAFINHQEDESKGLMRDMYKVQNIDLVAGDGSGTLGTISAGATSTTQTLALGFAAFQWGSKFVQIGDLIDFYDSTLTTSRTAGAGVSVVSIVRSTGGAAPTVLLSASVATTTGDFVTRGPGRANKVYTGFWGATHNQGTTFQGLSTTTFPQLNANRINANGQPLTEGILQSLIDAVSVYAGADVTEFLAGHAQFAAYMALGYAQKRFTGPKLDKGYQTLEFDGKPFIKEVDQPSSAVYALTNDTIRWGEVQSMGFGDLDGSILKWVAGFMAYTAYIRESGQMIYTNPNQLAVADNLFFPLTNTAYAQ